MIVALIAAVARNGVIGIDGGLPWHLPADLKHFKHLTTGHTLIIGRKTYESIGKPLPGRRMVVVSRREGYSPEGVNVAQSLDSALALCREETRVFIGGGAQLYSLALPIARELFLTRIEGIVDGDTYFPVFDENHWRPVSQERHEPDSNNPYAYSFIHYRRINDASSQ